MRKQDVSVDLNNMQKQKYSPSNKTYDLNLRSSLDQKIGVTRMPESSIIPQEAEKIRFQGIFTLNPKNKRQAYSTQKIYDKQKAVRLPSIRKLSFFNNPQQRSSYFKKQIPKKTAKKIYYQGHIKASEKQLATTKSYVQKLANGHFIQTIQALKIGRHLKLNVSPSQQLSLRKKNPKFKTVFLDLDETLIHCDQASTNYTIKLHFPVQNGEIIQAGIRVRPYCRQFLQQLCQFAEIIIFTASSQSYADVVLKYLDPHNKIFSHRLYRNHCTLEKGYYMKDLRIANRRLQDSVLVDNSAYCFMLQPFNGIPILPYYHYAKDTELLTLLDFLKHIFKEDDVRVPIKNTFFWHKYFQNDNDPRRIFQTHFQQNSTQ